MRRSHGTRCRPRPQRQRLKKPGNCSLHLSGYGLPSPLCPEFLNRIDDTIVFHPLQQENLLEIVQIQLKRLQKRLDERGIELEMSPEAMKFLSETGFDPLYGARPLKRATQKELETPLARALLSGTFRDGQKLNVQFRNGRIEFELVG